MVCYGIFWSGQLDDYNLQIKTGVLVCGNMQDLMLTKLLTLLKMERGGVQLVLLFMPDSSLPFFFRDIFFWNLLRAQKSALKNSLLLCLKVLICF